MAVAIGTVALLVIWLFFIFSAYNPDRGEGKIDTPDHAKARSRAAW
jgi:hypothetical protein